MSIHTNIKIKYAEEGYLPNLPPHLISDEEMFDAFMENDISYFYMNYPLLDEALREEYDTLVAAIKFHIKQYRDEGVAIPDWVYSYMLGVVINNSSPQLDRHFLLVGLNCDVIDDFMTPLCQSNCYQVSKKCVNRLPKKDREVWVDDELVQLRPPTLFGEPHVIKYIRVNGAS